MAPLTVQQVRTCAGCLSLIKDRLYLTCRTCLKIWDLKCANIPECRFNNTMSPERKKNWRCPECKCKQKKGGDNSETPVKQTENLDRSYNNVTIRRDNNRNIPIPDDNEMSIDDIVIQDEENISGNSQSFKDGAHSQSVTFGSPPQGNTLLLDTSPNQGEIILTELRALRSQVTDQHRYQDSRINSLTETINKLQKTVETEIKSLRTICIKNSDRINELETINSHLRKELDEVKETITLIETRMNFCSQTVPTEPSCADVTLGLTHAPNPSEGSRETPNPQNNIRDTLDNVLPRRDNSKLLVLYGLNEYPHESEYELHDRIIRIFHEIINVNLTGYIEDLQRIGRRGWRRPIVIELLSKRMAKYLQNNVNCFKNSGLWLSEYLDEKGLNTRKLQKSKYQETKQRRYSTRQQTKSSHPIPQHEFQHTGQPSRQPAVQPLLQNTRQFSFQPPYQPLRQSAANQTLGQQRTGNSFRI